MGNAAKRSREKTVHPTQGCTVFASVPYPRLPYRAMKDAVLGKTYSLSLTFLDAKESEQINKTHRKKEYVPNVLAFPLEDSMGEILITPEVAYREARDAGLSQKGRIAYLFIHGLLHLRGHHHGDTMEKAERRILKRFGVKF